MTNTNVKCGVDLTLIRRLLSELETHLSKAETLKSDPVEYVAELARASGMAATMMGESSLLMTDIQVLVQQLSLPKGANAKSLEGMGLESINKFLGIKGPGNYN